MAPDQTTRLLTLADSDALPEDSAVRVEIVEGVPPVMTAPVPRHRQILSPGTRRTDRVAKLAEYAEVGVEHYVLVDPEGSITEFVHADDAYRLVATHQGSATLAFGPTITLPG